MARAALIDATGTVTNVVEAPPEGLPDGWAPPGITVHPLAEDEPVGPGWLLDGGTLVAPAVPEPEPGDSSEEDFHAAVSGANSLEKLKAAILGESGPGAEPRRGRPSL